MTAVSPVISEEYQALEKIYAKDQPEYLPLPVHRSPDGVVLSRWRFTDAEREAITAGADLYLYNHTFNQPLQPIRMEVCSTTSTLEIAEDMWLTARVSELRTNTKTE